MQSLTRRRDRQGTTTVEFALVCPIVFTLFFACIEFGRAHQIQNAVAYSAYQGCRRAIVPGATSAQAVAAAQAVLDAGLIKSATVTVNPANLTNTTNTVTVTVAVNLDANSWTAPFYAKGKVLTRGCTLTREKTN